VGIAYRKLLSECGSRKQASYPKVVQCLYLTPTASLKKPTRPSLRGWPNVFSKRKSFHHFHFYFFPI